MKRISINSIKDWTNSCFPDVPKKELIGATVYIVDRDNQRRSVHPASILSVGPVYVRVSSENSGNVRKFSCAGFGPVENCLIEDCDCGWSGYLFADKNAALDYIQTEQLRTELRSCYGKFIESADGPQLQMTLAILDRRVPDELLEPILLWLDASKKDP